MRPGFPLEFIMSVLPCWGASLGGGRAATLMLELWHMYILECPLGLLSEQGHSKISRRENTQETMAHEGWEQGRREHMQSPWETEAARVESGVLKVNPHGEGSYCPFRVILLVIEECNTGGNSKSHRPRPTESGDTTLEHGKRIKPKA